jgi:pimeloyl-ACP methyl ester carboxylesterase
MTPGSISMKSDIERPAPEPAVLTAYQPPQPGVIPTRAGPIECIVVGKGPAVILLHGGAGGCDQGWLLARSAISNADRFMCIAPSRPGYLNTPLAAGPSPEQQADLFADMLDALGVVDALVLAISGGGPSALQFALRHRGRCRGLVLISACSGRLSMRLPFRFYLLKLCARFPALLDLLLSRSTTDPERSLRRAIADVQARTALLADEEAHTLFTALQSMLRDRLDRRLAGTENDHRRFSATTGCPLEQIAVPVLAIHGTADRVVSLDHARAVATRVPGAELLAIEGGEHVCLFTHYKIIRERIERFVERIPPPR